LSLDKSESSGIHRYYQSIQALQRQVIEGQIEILQRLAGRMAETIGRRARIFVFGSGHSHLLAEEAFFRAGGLAAVVPVFSSALMLHEDAGLGSRLERTPGLARSLLERYDPQTGEMIFIFSNSGVNQLPVEMALVAHELGLYTVAVVALAYAKVSPLSEIGKRLDEVVHTVIDNGGQPGDALIPVSGSRWRAGPSSTILAALIWNCLVTGTVERLRSSGMEAPLFASFNLPGAAAHNQELLDQWRKVNPHL